MQSLELSTWQRDRLLALRRNKLARMQWIGFDAIQRPVVSILTVTSEGRASIREEQAINRDGSLDSPLAPITKTKLDDLFGDKPGRVV